MYESPIRIYETAVNTIIEQRDNAIFAKVQDAFDVQVDKKELIRALQYDRDQYEKGYQDGKRAALDELVRCKDCKYRGDYGCPMYHEEYIKWDDDVYHESEIVEHDRTRDDGFCDLGERKDNEID